MRAYKQIILELIDDISVGTYERRQLLLLSILCAFAGENIFLLGAPGVAKSMIAKRIKLLFYNATAFEYLMSRFSTPDEIFGPVSIQKLKDEDKYERMVIGYLPTADIVFLDEIWKAGPSIQNALLTILNEKVFRNGDKEIRLPVKLIIAASNELPAEGEGLDALWDRFLVRCVVENIQDKNLFYEMITSVQDDNYHISISCPLTETVYSRWQKDCLGIGISPIIKNVVDKIRDKISEGNQTNVESGVLYISDRRWKKSIHLMRTCALLNNRQKVNFTDCFLLEYILWNDDSQISFVRDMVKRSITEELLQSYVELYRNYRKEIETLHAEIKITIKRKKAPIPNSLIIVDGLFYRINTVESHQTLIPISLYSKLSDQNEQAKLHKNGTYWQLTLVTDYNYRVLPDILVRKGENGCLIINEREYPLERYDSLLIINRYATQIYEVLLDKRKELDELKKKLIHDIEQWNEDIADNIFKDKDWVLSGEMELVTLIGEFSATIFEMDHEA
nr:AAA family ATPase [uncultured Bacteroides sp.]